MNNHFKIIIPFYNVEEWIKICIRSVKAQNYENFHCILVDDLSTDKSAKIVEEEIKNDSRFTFIKNTEKAYALKNIYDAINFSNPNDEDIIVTLDGDDWFANANVLNLLSDTYNEKGCWITYGSYAEYPSGKKGKFAKQIPQQVIDSQTYRQREWCSSHLRTFKYRLWKSIKKEDLLDNEGNFYQMAWDLAFMFPMLEMAGTRSEYIKDILYVYNMSNPLNDHKVDNTKQVRLEREIRLKNPYQVLNDFGTNTSQRLNLFDSNISHALSYNDSLEKGRKSQIVTYVKKQDNFNGVTLFTDKHIKFANNVESTYKVAWLMEPRAFDPSSHKDVEANIDNFDCVLTYDHHLHEKYPQKAVWLPADGLFVDTETIYSSDIEKSKNISHIYSNKTFLPGHKMRHEVARIFRSKYDIDYYGRGCNPVQIKSDALRDYRFSIVIENNKSKNYFTEKILDCFACRTIPLYWGAPNIGHFFDKESIITFDTIEELEQILPTLNEELYRDKFESLQKNYLECLKYYDFDNLVYDALRKRGLLV